MKRLRFPAEWEPQSAVLLAWPHAGTDWAPRLASVQQAYIGLIAAITRFEPVLLCVADETLRTHAETRLAEAGVDASRFGCVVVEYDDTWLRDTGPVTLVSGIADPRIESEAGSAATQTHRARDMPELGDDDATEATESLSVHAGAEDPAFVLLDFRFTGWGGKFEAGHDDRLVEALAGTGLFGQAAHQMVDFALEGGAIETDGQGTLLTTWRCLQARHPGQARETLARKLCDLLHQDRVLWLEHGALQGDDTDAHIDTLARFAAPDAIVFQSCDDPADPHYADLQAMQGELAAFRTADDQPYRLFGLPWPRPILDAGRRLAASYANFLIVNGAVLMPAYDDPADTVAAGVLAQAFPARQIVPVPCRPLIWQNGSLHCLTMQLPKGLL